MFDISLGNKITIQVKMQLAVMHSLQSQRQIGKYLALLDLVIFE